MTHKNLSDSKSISKGDYELRSPEFEDVKRVVAFARALPPNDLLYLRRDISQPPVADAWLTATKDGDSLSLLAEQDGEIVGMSALILDRKSWSPHVGEIRVLIAENARGRGLGRLMVQETFAQAVSSGIEKIIAQMTLDQTAARAVFQELGFEQEALLKEHVRDRRGEDHDIVIMSCNVASAVARMSMHR